MTYVTRRLAAARDRYRYYSTQLAFVRRVWTHEGARIYILLSYERAVLAALDELWLAQQEAERALPQVRP